MAIDAHRFPWTPGIYTILALRPTVYKNYPNALWGVPVKVSAFQRKVWVRGFRGERPGLRGMLPGTCLEGPRGPKHGRQACARYIGLIIHAC